MDRPDRRRVWRPTLLLFSEKKRVRLRYDPTCHDVFHAQYGWNGWISTDEMGRGRRVRGCFSSFRSDLVHVGAESSTSRFSFDVPAPSA